MIVMNSLKHSSAKEVIENVHKGLHSEMFTTVKLITMEHSNNRDCLENTVLPLKLCFHHTENVFLELFTDMCGCVSSCVHACVCAHVCVHTHKC